MVQRDLIGFIVSQSPVPGYRSAGINAPNSGNSITVATTANVGS